MEKAKFASHRPAFSKLLRDPDGNLWVEHYHKYAEPAARYSVFDRTGRWVTDVQMPRGLEVYDIGRGYVLGLYRDRATGIETIRLHHLRR